MIGNSLGWYTALAVAGALPFDDAFRLVQEMAILQQEPLPDGGPGGQVIYPLADAAWRPDPHLQRRRGGRAGRSGERTATGTCTRASTSARTRCWPATRPASRACWAAWRRCEVGERLFPLRLSQHGPYHTPLVAHVAAAAARAPRRPGLARPAGDADRRARCALDARGPPIPPRCATTPSASR